MKLVLSSLAIALLMGCAQQPKTEVVVRNEYIVRTAPDQLKKLPSYPEPIDVATADQVALARWINRTEGYLNELEAMIVNLISFYEAPVTKNAEVSAASAAPLTSTDQGYVDPAQRRLQGFQ